MRCEEFLRQLDADEGWDRGEAAAHSVSCPSCAAAARRMGAAAAAFRAMREDDAPPFLHTRILAHVRSEAVRRPWWQSALGFRTAWAGPLVVMAVVVVLGGYGLKQTLGPDRKPVPQADLARPGEVALGDKSKAMDRRAQVPPVELPQVGVASQSAEKDQARKSDAAGGKGYDFAPELTLSEPGAPAAPERSEEKQLRELEAAPVEPLTPPFLGAAAEPQDESRVSGGPPVSSYPPAPSAPVPPAPAAASVPSAPVGDDRGALSAATKEEVAPRARSADGLTATGAPQKRTLVDLVPCTLKDEGGREYVQLQLPPPQAPPPGVEWVVTVKRDGAVEVRDASGGWLAGATEAFQTRVVELDLLPGRYALARRP